MNGDLFLKWPLTFDAYIGKTLNLQTVLLLDNANFHLKANTLPVLNHVEVVYLLARTKSRIQPLDAGIIANVKRRYRLNQLERAIDLLGESYANDLYRIDIYTVMQNMFGYERT